MKKLKIVCFSLMSIFLFFFGVFSFGVGVKAAYEDEWGAPESAKTFVDKDGKGIRLYFLEVYVNEDGFFEYANLVPVKDYEFVDGLLEAGADSRYGRNYFDLDIIDYMVPYYVDRWGVGNTIPEFDRAYVYFSPVDQCFSFEFRGSGIDYAAYWMEQYSSLYDELGYDDYFEYGYDAGYYDGFSDGYSEGLDEGYDEGYFYGHIDGYNEGIQVEASEAYQAGFNAGQKSRLAENNAAFYQGIEKWLVPAIITVIALGGFVSIAVRKRRDE